MQFPAPNEEKHLFLIKITFFKTVLSDYLNIYHDLFYQSQNHSLIMLVKGIAGKRRYIIILELQALIASNRNLNIFLMMLIFQSGFTALHVAAHYGQIDFVREMLTRVPATVRSEPPHTNEPTVREIGHEVKLK